MRLLDADIRKLLPQFMRNDEAVKVFSQVISEYVQKLVRVLPLLHKWDQIDFMEERELDELAWELNILWYDASAPIDTKRAVIRHSDMVYARMGTKWAVEQVVRDIFGSGEIREWWEYGGEPHHFKVLSGNPSLTNQNYEHFLSVLETVKRKSSWLDGILITLTGEMKLHYAVIFPDAAHETVFMGDGRIKRYTGALFCERGRETVTVRGGEDI